MAKSKKTSSAKHTSNKAPPERQLRFQGPPGLGAALKGLDAKWPPPDKNLDRAALSRSEPGRTAPPATVAADVAPPATKLPPKPPAEAAPVNKGGSPEIWNWRELAAELPDIVNENPFEDLTSFKEWLQINARRVDRKPRTADPTIEAVKSAIRRHHLDEIPGLFKSE